MKNVLRPWSVTLLTGLLYVGWILHLGNGDPLVFAEIGTRFAAGDPAGTEGYDGQFFYYIAVDPLNAPPKIDVPAYRFQRILYPMLSRLLSLGKVELIPWLLIAVNLGGLAGSVWVAEQLLVEQRVHRWHALPVGLYAGQLLSIRVDLPEPLALLLILLAMGFFERHRSGRGWLLSAGFFVLAIFTKETMLPAGLAYVLYLVSQKSIKQGVLFGAVLIIPFAIYQIFLFLWLGSFGLGSGGAGATPFEFIPFGGLFRVAQTGWTVFGLFSLILGPIVIWPVLWSLYATGRDVVSNKWHPWTLALGLQALIIPFLPHSTFREPLAMLRFTVPLVALVILYSAYTKRWRVLNYSYLWLFTLVFISRDSLL